MKNRTITVTTMLLSLGFLALPRTAQAVVPAPDGGYPGQNTAEGQDALLSLNVNTGTHNTAVGWWSLRSNVQGHFNTAIGSGTLATNTGEGNTAIGGAALFSNTTVSYNTAVGLLALFHNTEGPNNTAIGSHALFSNTVGVANTANGRSALVNNTSGGFNTANGFEALFYNTTGFFNTAVGGHALLSNTTGNDNTAVGRNALLENTTGEGNTAIGHSAGESLTTGDGNVCIGADVVGLAGWANLTRIRNIGSTPLVGGSNVVISGTGGIGDGILGYASSSRRYKEDIKPMDKASETLFALKPVTFRAKGNIDHQGDVKHYGLIAEDVATVDPDLVVYNPEGEPETLRFDSINAMLLNEFLKEHKNVQELKAALAQQQKEIAALIARIKEQDVKIQRVGDQLEMRNASPQVASVK